MRLGVQYPIHSGGKLATYNATPVNDTDWHSLSSDDFYDTQTGTQLASGLKFAFVEFVSSSTDTFSVACQALSGGQSITTIAYKKAAGSDSFVVYAGFNA